jgi:hypothetical protein
MADKQYNIKVGVDSSDVDKAVQKTGELKKLSEKISIQYDIDGKPIDVVIDKSLNLQKQVRELTAQLRKTKEGTAEFKLLSSALGDAQDGLARSNAKSRDLLASLQLIPGPVGEIASQLNGAIGLLKTFSSFSLKDIQFQFKETVNDFKDIYKGFLGLNKAASETTNVTDKLENSGKNLNTTLTNTTANAGATAGVFNRFNKETLDLISGLDKLEESNANVNTQIRKGIPYIEVAGQKMRQLSADEIAAVKSGAALTVTTEGLVVAEKQATFWTSTLGKTIQGVLIGTGIGIAIVAIGELVSWLYRLATAESDVEKNTKLLKDAFTKNADAAGEAKNKVEQVGVAFAEARKKTISKKEALDEYNKVLGGTIGEAKTLEEAEALYNANTGNYIKATGLRAEAQELYALAAKKSTEALTAEEVGFWSFDRGLFQSYDSELKERKKKLNATADEFRKKGNELTAEALKLEKNYKPKEDKTETKTGKTADQIAEEDYQKRLKDLDARIQLEINKENTSREELSKLLEKRAAMVEKHDKYTAKQSELLRQENGKKLQSALDDDTKRVEAYVSKVQDIEINAIQDEQQRTEAAREKKRDDDIRALKYDEEYIKGSEEEKAKIKLNIETQYQMDLLKIRDQFFQKQLQQERENFQRQVEYATRLKEEELAIGQQRIEDKTKFNDVYGDFFFGNKGLKKMYEKYFVDIRGQYAKEYDANNLQFSKELGQLSFALANKKITQETYATEVKNIEDRTRQNKETYTQRMLDLDKLEIDSKNASADVTLQIAERLGDFYDTLIQIRSADYENAQKDLDDKLKLYKKDTKEYNGVLKEKKALEENYLAQVKKMQINAALFDAAVSIARIIIDTQRAIIAFSASVAPLGPAGIPIAAGYAIKSKILAALSIATIVGSGIAKIKGIEGQKGSTEGGDSGESGNGMGRGYADGGIVRGPGTSKSDSIPARLSNGEAVLTSGAVTMFAPLLSMMNQMGGGTSFSNMNVVRPDNPILSNPAQEQAPIIVKSYVVEKDMTSSQQKQSRLKDLSTL